jgi:quinol monooxygenase YgiN
MIIATMNIHVFSDHRKELVQTIHPLVKGIREESGCDGCHVYQDMNDENRLFFVEEWNSQGDLDAHLRSEHFRVLMGAINLLSESLEIRFNSVCGCKGIEAVEAARVSREDSESTKGVKS